MMMIKPYEWDGAKLKEKNAFWRDKVKEIATLVQNDAKWRRRKSKNTKEIPISEQELMVQYWKI